MAKRKSQKKNRLVAIVLILIMLISIGYAFLSTTLNINGTANITAAQWSVYFDNVQVKDGSVEAATPVIGNDSNGAVNTVVTYEVDMSTPGEFYEFNVDIVNDGSIDAMINSIDVSDLTEEQAKYLTYTVTYADGGEIKAKDLLAKQSSDTIKVALKYEKDIEVNDLPKVDEKVTATVEIEYVQADDTAQERTSVSSKAGLYKTGTDEQIYTWEQMVELGIFVEGNELVTVNHKELLEGDLYIKEGITTIGADLMDENGMMDMEIFEKYGIDESGANYVFCGCTGLTSITVPQSVTYLGYMAFSQIENLSSLTINSNFTGVNQYTFQSLIDTVIITENVEPNKILIQDVNVDKNVLFMYVKNFEVDEKNPYYKDIDGVLFSKDGTSLIKYPGSREAETYSIPNGVTKIESVAFLNDHNLEEVVIPDSVITIAAKAFAWSYLDELTVPNSVTTIGDLAFWDIDIVRYEGNATGAPWGASAVITEEVITGEELYITGDEITIGTEKFYVIENVYEDTEIVKLLAKNNIVVNTLKQSTNDDYNDNIIRFSSTNYWENERSYPLDLNNYSYENPSTDAIAVAKAYANSLGVGATGRLMTYEEARNLERGKFASKLYSKNFWLGFADSSKYVWFVYGGDSSLDIGRFDSCCGVRPVIEISKSFIQ